ncbi:MAG TPA: RNA polymerase sigma factor [Firmicutes bacterium]|nr:RNA polymerase sigma factor [Bacillota bacterium]
MEINEQELIRRAKKGHQDALEQIFRYHLDSAIRLAYLITRNWATAEDAVQEAFLQAFRSLDSFQDERPFKPWFTKIVVNKAKRTKDRLDRGHLPYDLEEPNPHRAFAPEEHALEREGVDALFQAINELDENHRLPLLLKYVSGLTEAQIAETLSIPVSRVKSRLYVARQRLKKHIAALEGGGSYEDI